MPSKTVVNAGLHVNINTFDEYVRSTDMNCAQVFVVTPMSTKFMKIDAKALKKQIRDLDLIVYIHTSYVINPWGQKPYNMALSVQQLRIAYDIGARGVVFHIPKVPFFELVEKFKKLLEKKPPRVKIIMENRAAIPNECTLETPEKMNQMTMVFLNSGIKVSDIRFCIDSAHLHSTGTTLRTYNDAKRWLDALKYPKTIIAFHLNGSMSDNNADHHTCPFVKNDRIWHGMKFADSGFCYILKFCKRHKIDVIFEVDWNKYSKHLKDLINTVQTS